MHYSNFQSLIDPQRRTGISEGDAGRLVNAARVYDDASTAREREKGESSRFYIFFYIAWRESLFFYVSRAKLYFAQENREKSSVQLVRYEMATRNVRGVTSSIPPVTLRDRESARSLAKRRDPREDRRAEDRWSRPEDKAHRCVATLSLDARHAAAAAAHRSPMARIRFRRRRAKVGTV